MHPTVVNSMLVDKIAGLDDSRFWSDFRLTASSADSFTKYSMMDLNVETVESMIVNDDVDCPCLLPPPDFDVGPPPKPFFLADQADDPFRVDLGEDESCPLNWPGFVSNTIVPNERTSVNEPLIFIITATAVMALALIIFTILLIWCQRKGWCKRKSKLGATFSSDTEGSTTCYSTGMGRKTEWSFNHMNGDKKLPQTSNLGILMYGGQSDQQKQISQTNDGRLISHRPLPTLPRLAMTPSFPRRPPVDHSVAAAGSHSLNTRPRRYMTKEEANGQQQNGSQLYDSHNPVYEEISLSGFDQCPVHANRIFVDASAPIVFPESSRATNGRRSVGSDQSSVAESPCSCQSCGKSASIELEEEDNPMIGSPSPKRKVSTINQSTQSEETFLNNDEENYCECAGRESGYGTEGYPASSRDLFGTWDSPKRVSPPGAATDRNGGVKNLSNKRLQKNYAKNPTANSSSSLWVSTSDDKSKRSGSSCGAGPFAVFSGPNSAYV